jgi:hypothetical protein
MNDQLNEPVALTPYLLDIVLGGPQNRSGCGEQNEIPGSSRNQTPDVQPQ